MRFRILFSLSSSSSNFDSTNVFFSRYFLPDLIHRFKCTIHEHNLHPVRRRRIFLVFCCLFFTRIKHEIQTKIITKEKLKIKAKQNDRISIARFFSGSSSFYILFFCVLSPSSRSDAFGFVENSPLTNASRRCCRQTDVSSPLVGFFSHSRSIRLRTCGQIGTLWRYVCLCACVSERTLNVQWYSSGNVKMLSVYCVASCRWNAIYPAPASRQTTHCSTFPCSNFVNEKWNAGNSFDQLIVRIDILRS